MLVDDGGKNIDGIPDADVKSSSEQGQRLVQRSDGIEERMSTMGPSAIEETGFDHEQRDDGVGGMGRRSPGGVVGESEISAEPNDRSAAHHVVLRSPPHQWRRRDIHRLRGVARRGCPSSVGPMPYEVHTPVFDGPFDLLLHLILREQVDLYEIALSEIVDAYLAELKRMEALDLEVATEFLLIAATLVELKARRLLPDDDEIDLDDELGLWEERDLLLARLVECKTFKDAALILRKLSAVAARSYPRKCGPVEEHFLALAPDLLENTTPDDLRAAYLKATAPKPVVRVDLSHVTPIKVTVAEAVEELVDELPRVGRMTFRNLTADLVDRIDVVVRFLAVLELFKQGVVELDQASAFGDITVIWTGGDSVDAESIVIDTYEG